MFLRVDMIFFCIFYGILGGIIFFWRVFLGIGQYFYVISLEVSGYFSCGCDDKRDAFYEFLYVLDICGYQWVEKVVSI